MQQATLLKQHAMLVAENARLKEHLAHARAEIAELGVFRDKYTALKGRIARILHEREEVPRNERAAEPVPRLFAAAGLPEQDPFAMDDPSAVATDPAATKRAAPVFPHVQVVRRKHEREQLKGQTCTACRDFFRATGLASTGVCDECSRHRSKYTFEATPAGFWDVEFADSSTQPL
jgi:hypothetical protein